MSCRTRTGRSLRSSGEIAEASPASLDPQATFTVWRSAGTSSNAFSLVQSLESSRVSAITAQK